MNSQKCILFTNASIFLPSGFIHNASLYVKEGKILHIFKEQDPSALYQGNNIDEIIDVKGSFLVPGFIDVHVHGGNGYDVMSGNKKDIDGLCQFHASKGTTSLLPTTVTHNQHVIETAIKAIMASMKESFVQTKGSEILGIHLEGPFLNAERAGAQNPQYIRKPNINELNKYVELSQGNIRLMTIAPEQEGALEVIEYGVKHGITMSIGHSDSNYDIVHQAVIKGVSHVTHLFNGMSPLHHREPGVAGAALMLDALAVEVICDGIHMSKEVISFVFQVKPEDKIVLITDCVSAAGCKNGRYELGSLPIVLKDNQVRLINENNVIGSLAGSCLTMDQALRNVMQFTGLKLEQILPTLTINPAKQIGCSHRKGSIEIGKDADLVILDQKYGIMATYVNGEKVFESKK